MGGGGLHFESDFYARLQPSLNEPLPAVANSIVVAAAVKCTVSPLGVLVRVPPPPRLAFIRPLAGPPCFSAEKGRCRSVNLISRLLFNQTPAKWTTGPFAAGNEQCITDALPRQRRTIENQTRQVQARIQSATPIRGPVPPGPPRCYSPSVALLAAVSFTSHGLQETCLSAHPLHQKKKQKRIFVYIFCGHQRHLVIRFSFAYSFSVPSGASSECIHFLLVVVVG